MPPTVRDRTQEFFATVDSFQQLNNQPTRTKPLSSPSKLSKQSIQQSSQIKNLSNQIAETISQVNQKIIELEQLAKLTSNFRDERPKIQSLMFTIKKDIDNLNINLKTLKTFLGQSFSNIASNNNIISHHKSLLDLLTARYGQLAKSFSTACEISTKHLQRQKREKEKFHHKKSNFRKVPLNRLRRRNNNNESNSETEALLASDSLSINGINGHELVNKSQSQSQMVMFKEPQYNDQRTMEAEAIETQLTEISQMMAQLANIVDQQRHTIIQIGDNVDDSIQHVEGAIQQLQKYLSSMSGNRWLM
eukprot:923426_1